MAYTKQNFVDGEILTAENLNLMEDGISTNETAIATETARVDVFEDMVLDVLLTDGTKGLKYTLNDTYAECSGIGECTETDIEIGSIVRGQPVTSIASNAFNSCENFTSVTIPDSITKIKSSAFYGCSNLTRVNIEDIAGWCEINFFNSTANPLCCGAGLYIDGEIVSVLNIPNSVTKIHDYVFCDCTSLTSITLPNGVTSIGTSAFDGCTSLTSITIPDGATNIYSMAFYGCTSLTSATIGNGVTNIGKQAFQKCLSLMSVTIPNSVTGIDSYAFYNCTNLTDIYYGGTAEEWAAITIGSNNDALSTATIHYNNEV